MTRSFPLLLLFFIGAISFGYSQNDLYSILNSKKSFANIVQQADAYFAAKYPGLKPYQLAEGEHRDGEFVKYMRWKSYWQTHLNPDGTLGDPSTYWREGRPGQRTLGLYCDVDWNNISIPENLGGQIGVGRTTSVAFHPTDINTFWVSTAIGGVWKTEDGGQSYIPIGDQLPTLAVSVVAVDPSNPDNIYVATGDRVGYGLSGIGIYKSTDGGQNWTSTALGWEFSNQFQTYAMAIDPSNPSTIFVAGDNGFFKTTDGFATVEQVDGGKYYDVQFKPGDPNVIYAVNSNFFVRSTNGGESFDNVAFIPPSGFTRIAVTPADPERVYYSRGNTLYQSYDEGTTFSETKSISDLDNGDFGYVFISHEDADVLYGGYFSTWKSTNNGANWTQITCFSGGDEIHVDNHFAAVNPLALNEIYFCNDGGLYKLPETGACFNCFWCYPEYIDLSGGMKISQYYDISNSQQQNAVISGGTQDNGSFFRTSSGDWEFFASTGDGMNSAIDPTDDTYRYWEYQFGSIRRYANGSNTCISCTIPNGEDGNGAWETPYTLDPNNPSVIIVGYRRLYRSTNRGDSWLEMSDELANGSLMQHIEIAPSNSEVVYAATFSQLFRTINASTGAIWEELSSPTSTITHVNIDPTNSDRLYISSGGYSAGEKVYMSEDGGQTWTNISGSLPNVPVSVIKTVNDSNYDKALFVGTDAGVYYLDASLDDWELYGDALPHTQVRDIEFMYSSQLIRIGTHGRSIYEAPLPLNACLSDTPPDADGDGVCDSFDLCPDGDDTVDLDLDGQPDACETYCTSIGAPGTGSDWINNVVLNTIDHPSGQTDYSDFTDISTTLEQGLSYSLELGLNFSFDLDVAYAWIDYNQNREFEESERIPMSDFNGQHVSFGDVVVPNDALLGPTVLRVRCIYSNNPTPEPCNAFFGEVEDYTVIIESSTNTVDVGEAGPSVQLSPNPARDQVQVQLEGWNTANVDVLIFTMDGKTVVRSQLPALPSAEPTVLPLDNCSPGVYLVQVSDGKQTAVQKLVVQ